MQDFLPIKKELENLLRSNKINDIEKYIAELDKIFAKFDQTVETKKALERSETKYKALFEKAADAIFIVKNNKFIDCNPAIFKMFECTRDYIIGKTPFDLSPVSQPDGELSSKKVAKIIELALVGEVEPFEWVHLTKNGKEFIVEVHLSKIEFDGEIYLQAVLRDITRQKEAEEALRLSELKYRSLIEKIPVGIIVHDSTSKIVTANNYASEFLGLSIDQLLGREIIEEDWNFIRQDESKMPLSEFPVIKVLNTLIAFDNYIVGVRRPKFNDTVWGMVNAEPEFDEKGELQLIITSFIDVTNRIRTEKALNDSQARNKILADLTIEGILIHENGKITDVNHSLEKILNTDMDNIVGRSIFDFIHPAYKEMILENMKTRYSNRYEIEIIRADGKILPVEVEAKTYLLNNKLARVVAVRDITQRKEAEEEIRKLFTAVVQSPAAIVITDTKGEIEFVNPQFTAITGYKSEEAIGKNPRILKSGNTPEQTYAELWKTILAGETWKGEFQNKRKNGELFWESAIIAPLKNEQEKIVNFIAVKEDITYRKAAEEALRHSEQKLIEANSTKDKFFSIIAHDLKNPFNIILGFTDLLMNNYKDFDKDTLDRTIRTINEVSLKTFNLLENLLDWSKSQTEKLVFNPRVLEINSLIKETFALFHETANNKNIDLILETPGKFNVMADFEMVSTILRNLINNGIKFTPKRGKVAVSISDTGNNHISVKVSDTGIGIKADKLNILFNIDRNWSTPGTEDEVGTGLGLILCKEFVEKNNGELSVESEPGHGTIFTFTLPRA